MLNDEQINGLLREMKSKDPELAVRQKARQLVKEYCEAIGEDVPLDLNALASYRGIKLSDEMPVHSADAELVPDGTGSVSLRLNPDQPETRKRFSVAHEISHTFFPGFELSVQCRPDNRIPNAAGKLESLCDVGASELLFPYQPFKKDCTDIKDLRGLLGLIAKYQASREATLRRFVEVNDKQMAVAYLSWKMKPSQKREVMKADQDNLFGFNPEDESKKLKMLRVDYVVCSDALQAQQIFIPKDKSIDDELILNASRGETYLEGESEIHLGTFIGHFKIAAFPLYTSLDTRGPNGESSVAVVLEPIKVVSTRKKAPAKGVEMF